MMEPERGIQIMERCKELGITFREPIQRENGSYIYCIDLSEIPKGMTIQEVIDYIKPDYIGGTDPYEQRKEL